MKHEKARQRTYDAMLRKAKAGHVTGGKCYGYLNVPIEDVNRQGKYGRPAVLGVQLQIRPEQAAIVHKNFSDVCGRHRFSADFQDSERRRRASTAAASNSRDAGLVPVLDSGDVEE